MEDINANLMNLVIQNLHQLLKECIENYLFNYEETKNKIQNTLDSLLRKLEANANASSCSTYTIDIRIKESSSKTNAESNITSSINLKQKPIQRVSQNCAIYSSIVVPQTRKHISIISTLNIPRFVYTCQHQMSEKMLHNSLNNIRKAYSRNILLSQNFYFLTISNSNRILSSASNIDLLEISTKSLTNHFSTCHDTTTVKECKKKHRMLFIPSSDYIFPESTSMTNLNEKLISTTQLDIDPMPSVVKCIFTDEISEMESNFVKAQHDRDTMTDKVVPIGELQTLCQNATNVSPQVTMNIATGNDNLHIHKTSGIDLRKEPMHPKMLTTPKIQPCACCDNNKTNTCKPCLNLNETEGDPLLTIDFVDVKDFNSNKKDKEAAHDKSTPVPCANKGGLLKKILPSRLKRCCFKEGIEKGYTNITDTFEKIRHKHFSYMYKKTDNKLKNNEFLEHFQDMFKYFANYKGKRNIHLDIRINVYPTLENDEETENKNEPPCSGCNLTANKEDIACDITKVTVKSSSECDIKADKEDNVCNITNSAVKSSTDEEV